MRLVNVLIGALIIILAFGSGIIFLLAWPSPRETKTEFGVTFSPRQATGLGLDWREVYTAMLDDLEVRHLRLVAYWDEMEPEEGQYNWEGMDWQLQEAGKRQTKVVLAMGRKVPRWPECFVPAWAQGLAEEEQQQRLLGFMGALVSRYQNEPVLWRWQLENEIFLNFGHCVPTGKDFTEVLEDNKKLLTKEEKLLREMDKAGRQIMVTDSGELNWWLEASRYGDILGTTLYRTVFSARTEKIFNYDYIFPAWVYRAKARLVRVLRGKEVVVAELQGEPWGRAPLKEMTALERQASVSPGRLREIARFAERTELPLAYWWGSEFWYWEKTENHNPGYWEAAKGTFR
jgi:hypothetical protein